ncbi:MAG: alpha/beta hydrolase [Rubrobacter sp.]|jgi:pimeloyl-ACP methyl ester carboxylesterase|nr:alpha/beta hydrolase [Rubrobacter sp.]
MEKKVETSRLEVAYEDNGDASAPPIVLVHGFPDDAKTWERVSKPLVEAGFRTIAPYVRGYGETRFLNDSTPRSGQIAALGSDLLEFTDALGLERFALVGHDWGARATYIAASMHPNRVSSLVNLAVGYGTNDPGQRLSPAQTRNYWYQWYFNLKKGKAELDENRRAFCEHLWHAWSPNWNFSDDEFEKTARSFDNDDFVDIAIHSYRHRWANAEGDPEYDTLEERLAEPPKIHVPTTLLMGGADGATLAETSEEKEGFFTKEYERRVLPGIGHFIQREAPGAVVDAVFERVRRDEA